MIENWKDIKGYEKLYQVSNFGRVRSFGKIVVNGVVIKKKVRILKPQNRNNYHKVTLCKNGEKCQISVHFLVLSTFTGSRPLGMVVNHKDLNKINNYLENLEYCTQAENVNDALSNGSGGTLKLSRGDIEKIRMEPSCYSYKFLSEKYNISASYLGRVKKGTKGNFYDDKTKNRQLEGR